MGKTAEELFLEGWNEFGFSGSDIEREHRFHPTRKWRFDFAFPSRKVAIEIDGRGRHQTVAGVRADCEKNNNAISRGWAVFRLPTSDIKGRDKTGEPLLPAFIELVCEFLTSREIYADTGIVQEGMEELPEVPVTRGSRTPRTVPRGNTGRSNVSRGGSGKGREPTG